MKRRKSRPVTPRPLAGMSSHFKKDGSPKVAYRTQREAQESAQATWTLHGLDLQTYRCDYCHQWHMGKTFREE